jgi:hypothetical protein
MNGIAAEFNGVDRADGVNVAASARRDGDFRLVWRGMNG